MYKYASRFIICMFSESKIQIEGKKSECKNNDDIILGNHNDNVSVDPKMGSL